MELYTSSAVPSNVAPLSNLYQAVIDYPSKSLTPFIRNHFRTLLADTGDWNPSIYDLAWVLCCDFFTPEEKEQQIKHLIAQQKLDGLWGESTYIPHSALIDTLGAMMALVRLDYTVPNWHLLEQSINALIIKCIDFPHPDTVAVEIIAPKLLQWLEQHNCTIKLTDEAAEFIERLNYKGEMKLNWIRQGLGLFDPAVSLSYTGEFAALIPLQEEEIDQLTQMMLPNGAIGLSPAATAAIIILLQQHNRSVPDGLYQYLQDTFADYRQSCIPNLHPIVTSRRLWNLRPWLLSGNIFGILDDSEILESLRAIYQDMYVDHNGLVSWDTNNAVLPDLDNTNVAFALYCLLAEAGLEVHTPMSSQSFKHFQREDGSFFCYAYELNASVAAILHTIVSMEIGIKTLGDQFACEPYNIYAMDMLLRELAPEGKTFNQLVHDKWHASWTYGVQGWLSSKTVHATYGGVVKMILAEVLRREQNGGWGQLEPTIEETAYVVSGLTALLNSPCICLSNEETYQIQTALKRSERYMLETLQNEAVQIPPLWISKNLYSPKYQIASAVLDALFSLLYKA